MSIAFSPNQKRRGVTLLEMVLAIGLMVLLSSLTFIFYSTSLEARDVGTERARKLRLARVVLDRLATELRQAPAITRDFGVGLAGDPEAILITTRRVPRRELALERDEFDDPPDGEYDLEQVQYRIARHPDIVNDDGFESALGLARVATKVPRPDSALARATADPSEESEETAPDVALDESFFAELFAGEDADGSKASLGPDVNWEELYAPEIRYIRFCYYDGRTWWDKWHVIGENALPQMVQVTIGYSEHRPFEEAAGQDEINEEFCECLNEDPPDCLPLARDEYSTVVRLTHADPLFRSRVNREGQAMIERIGKPEKKEGTRP